MNKKIQILVLASAGFLGGSIFAGFYHFTDENKSEESPYPFADNLSKESLASGIKSISQTNMNGAQEVIMNFLSLPAKDMDAKRSLFLRVAMDSYLRENPDAAIAILRSPQFTRAAKEIQGIYVYEVFSSLAYHYPERFADYFRWINNDKRFPSDLRLQVISAFFAKLNEENPRLSYRMLTDGSMDEFKNLKSSSGFGSMPQNLKTFFDIFKKSAIGNIGLEDENLLLSELKTGNQWENNQLLFALANRLSKKKDIDVVSWAKDHLPKENQDYFFSILIQRMTQEENSWQKSWDLANQIGFDKLNPWTLDQIIRKAAKEDTVTAIDMIESSLKGYTRESALANVLLELNKKQTPAEMLPIINGLSDGICKDQVIPAFFEKYLEESPEEAVAWALANRSTENWKFSNNYLNSILRKPSQQAQEAALLFWNADKSDDEVKRSIASTFAYNNSGVGIEFMGKLPEGERTTYAKNFYESMSSGNALGAIKSIKENQLLGENKAELTKEIVKRVSSTFPPTQLAAVLKETNDPELTKYAAEQYVWAFDRESSNDKENYIERALSSKLPEDFKKELETALEAKRNGAPRPEGTGNLIIHSGNSENW